MAIRENENLASEDGADLNENKNVFSYHMKSSKQKQEFEDTVKELTGQI